MWVLAFFHQLLLRRLSVFVMSDIVSRGSLGVNSIAPSPSLKSTRHSGRPNNGKVEKTQLDRERRTSTQLSGVEKHEENVLESSGGDMGLNTSGLSLMHQGIQALNLKMEKQARMKNLQWAINVLLDETKWRQYSGYEIKKFIPDSINPFPPNGGWPNDPSKGAEDPYVPGLITGWREGWDGMDRSIVLRMLIVFLKDSGLEIYEPRKDIYCEAIHCLTGQKPRFTRRNGSSVIYFE